MIRLAILTGVLASAFLVAAPMAPADAVLLSGTRFVEAMKDNTVAGRTADGTTYNIYFVEGGLVTYRDAQGRQDSGRWRIDSSGSVCLQWNAATTPGSGCFRVSVDGRRMTWSGQRSDLHAVLRGSVTSAYLQSRRSAAVTPR